MKPILFLACMAFGTYAMAQNVNYRILTDDPENVKAFSLSLEPLYGDLYFTDIHFGYSIRADLLLLKRMEVRADFRRAYFDMTGNETNTSEYHPKNGTKLAIHGEAGVSLFFVDKLKKTQAKLVLSSSSDGSYTYTKYIMIPATKRKMFGVRGGIYNNRVAYEMNGTDSFFVMKDNNGTETPAVDNTVTMFNSTSLYGGLHWKSIVDVVASTDYGTRKVGKMVDFYIDFLFAPVVNFGDIKSPTDAEYSLKANSDYVKRMGWRAGWVYRHPNKVGMCYKFEFGARPGFRSMEKMTFMSQRSYMLFTIGLNIPAIKKNKD